MTRSGRAIRPAPRGGRRHHDRGYVTVGLDHVARPHDGPAVAAGDGRLRHNFQGCTTDDAPVLPGLGASPISSPPRGHAQNLASVPA